MSLPCILSKILLIQLQADQTPVKPSSKFIDLTADSEDDVDDIPVQSQDCDDARIIRTPSPPAFATTSNTVKSEKRVASKTRSGVRSSPLPLAPSYAYAEHRFYHTLGRMPQYVSIIIHYSAVDPVSSVV